MQIGKSAGAVIFYRQPEGKIKYLLLNKNENDYWNFPKGHIEKGENEIEALKREIKEETGISKIKIIPGFKSKQIYYFRVSPETSREKSNLGELIFKIDNIYLAEVFSKETKISSEHRNYIWLPYDEALEKVKGYNGVRKTLQKADKFLKK
jgi:8-oxo-dGTP pyrophosphatase MutT (NUDIX family)